MATRSKYHKTKQRLKRKILRVKNHLKKAMWYESLSLKDGEMQKAGLNGCKPTMSSADLSEKLSRITEELDNLIVSKGESTVRTAG